MRRHQKDASASQLQSALDELMRISDPAKKALGYFAHSRLDLATAREYAAEGDATLARYFAQQAREINRCGVRYAAMALGKREVPLYIPKD